MVIQSLMEYSATLTFSQTFLAASKKPNTLLIYLAFHKKWDKMNAFLPNIEA